MTRVPSAVSSATASLPIGPAVAAESASVRSDIGSGPNTWKITTRAFDSSKSVDRERLPEVAARVGPRVRVCGRLGVPLQLVEALIDETPLERRYDHEVRTGERAPDDEKQRDGEARADPAGKAHRSRKR
jgi:hypothetical protein